MGRVLMWVGITVAGMVVIVAVLGGVVYLATGPEGPLAFEASTISQTLPPLQNPVRDTKAKSNRGLVDTYLW